MDNQLINADFFKILPDLPDKSMDAIVCDLPYHKTKLPWDSEIDLVRLWEEYKRLIKPDGNIVLTGVQPFVSKLIAGNPKWFRYELIWVKAQGTCPFVKDIRPLPRHESVLVFYNKLGTYNPQMTEGEPYDGFESTESKVGEVYSSANSVHKKNDGIRYPTSILTFARDAKSADKKQKHPTKKPLALMEYLIKTYTNEGDLILDNAMGSGTTCVAAALNNRKYIGIELEEKYFAMASERIAGCQNK